MEEKVLDVFHPTRLAFLKSYGAAVILLLIWGFLLFNPLNLDLSVMAPYMVYSHLLLLMALGIIAANEVRKRIETYTITDHRVKDREGIISISEASITWDQVADVSLNQTVLERVLDIGTIKIDSSAGGGSPEVVMRNVKKAPERKKEIVSNLMKWKDEKR